MSEPSGRRPHRPTPAFDRPGDRLRRMAVALPLLLLAAALPALEVPFLSGRVNDRAEMLRPEAEQRIEAALAALERETGAQVAVLTIPSLEGEVLEDFSIRVVERWKLGRAEVDDGVLLLVARDDRKLRIEVGYGLEGALPDVVAKRIVDERIVPEFREGDFEAGIEAGVDAIAGVVRGEELPPPATGPSGGGGPGGELAFAAVLLAALFTLASVVRRNAVRALAVGLAGALLVGFALTAFLTALWGILGAAAWLLLVFLLYLVAPASSGRKGGGWISAGSWSSSGGGGFSGGFSGGGGSFGGGGASGSW